MHILNGRMAGDSGDYIYIGATGNIVIDYVLIPASCFHIVDTFKIENRCESPHLPLYFAITSLCHLDNSTTASKSQTTHRYTFTEDNKILFKENMANTLSGEFLEELCEYIADDQSSVDNIATICKKTIQTKPLIQPKWFDASCKALKATKNKMLRRFRNNRSVENLHTYKNARKTFKQHCDMKRDTYNNGQLNDLIEKSVSPKSFWNRIK